jgi:hypothetical protein
MLRFVVMCVIFLDFDLFYLDKSINMFILAALPIFTFASSSDSAYVEVDDKGCLIYK